VANAWFRLYAEFASDPKVQMLSESNQRRLIMLFCCRCNNDVTLHDSEVTFMLRISNDEWQETKALFIAKGFIKNDNEILNWDKRQFTSDTSKNRVAAYRERKKQEVESSNNIVTLQKQKSNAIEQNRTEQIYSKKKTALPKDFSISERVNNWAIENNYYDLEKHLANFILACESKNYTYANWDSAFMTAIRDNWAKIPPKKKNMVVL
jgi:ribonuclease BN (tRNA processing enzyme)